MILDDIFEVRKIPKSEGKQWLLFKHYAKCIPSIIHMFGLIEKDKKEIMGVCCFGKSAGTPNGNFMGNIPILELNRLCVNENLLKNTLSFFVSQTLKKLEPTLIVVSYADPNWNHCGYIYQATNWLYVGKISDRKFFVKNGKEYHPKTIYNKYGTIKISEMKEKGYHTIKKEGKHKYFYIVAKNKKEKREILKDFKYPILPYPKGDNKRYDASYKVKAKGLLF